MYPFLGGTSGSTKFNALNPINTNGAFRLTFNGTGTTFNLSGVTFLNANAFPVEDYANTYFDMNSQLTGNSSTVGIYFDNFDASRGNQYPYGSYGGGSPEKFLSIEFDYPTPNTEYSLQYSRDNAIGSATTGANFEGQYTQGNNSGASYFRKNGNSLGTGTDSTARPGGNLYIGCLNLGGTAYRSVNAQFRFFYIADYLDATEAATIENIINTFQTSLGRNVY